MDNQDRHRLTVEPHPLLDLRAFVTVFPAALGNLISSTALLDLLSLDARTPLESSDEIRSAAGDLLRHGGFKPTGRSKPASEYLIKAAEQGLLSSINVAVDTCNVVSLHSGLPISVVDSDLEVHAPLQAIRIGDLGIAAIPFETFTETGLEIKDRGPFGQTFTVELANGSYGYLPTPEQHRLGGCETWLGTNFVEHEASTKIVTTIEELFSTLWQNDTKD